MPLQTLNDGIDNVVVTLDRPDVTYKSGQTMKGSVMVICDDTTPVKSIRLRILGRMSIFWRKVGKRRRKLCSQWLI